MTALEIQTRLVQIPNGDLLLDAYLARPLGPGKYPAVLVFQEIFGVNHHIRDLTRRLAREGYVAIAPALYQRQAPGFETGYTPADIEMGREYKNQTTAPELLSDAKAAIAYLQNLASVKGQAIGAIGFCFGGHVAYLVATLPEIRATASFYGAGITTLTPGGGDPTLSRTQEIQGTIHLFFGDQDASIPLEQVEQIQAELQKHQIDHQIFRYPDAEHGFFCDQRSSYHPEAAAAAWDQVKQLFQEKLGS